MDKVQPLLCQSTCHPRFTLHCNVDFFATMLGVFQDFASSSLSSHHKSIEQATINWLLCVDGNISCQQHNTFRSKTHLCYLQRLSFKQQIELISHIVYKSMFEDYLSPESSCHFSFIDQSDGNNTLILRVTCAPSFTLIPNTRSTECFQFIAQESQECRGITTKSLVVSWLLSSDCTIAVQQQEQESTDSSSYFIPQIISPFVELLSAKYNRTTKEDQKFDNLLKDKTPTPPQSPIPIQTLDEEIKEATQSPTTYTTPPRPKPRFHPYPTRSRNKEVSNYLKYIS